MERCADRCDARDRRQASDVRQPGLDLSERERLPALSHRDRRTSAGSRDRPAQRHPALRRRQAAPRTSSTRSTAIGVLSPPLSGDVRRRCRATRTRAIPRSRSTRAHVPGCTPTAPAVIVPADPRPATSTCGTTPRWPQRWRCDAAPQYGDLGIVDARLIAPGAPDRSVLLARTARRDASAMPPLASLRVDERGRGIAERLDRESGQLRLTGSAILRECVLRSRKCTVSATTSSSSMRRTPVRRRQRSSARSPTAAPASASTRP